MCFYSTNFNTGLKSSHDGREKLLGAFHMVEHDFDGDEVQYVPNDLLIQKNVILLLFMVL